MNRLGDISNDELFARLRAHVRKGHVWQARLIAYLAEVNLRRLDLLHACPSIWEFCVDKLGMSENAAQRRIAAARLVRGFPRVLGYLERGDVHICGLYALRKYLTEENHDELLREATGKSLSAIAELIARRFPKPDVPASIELVAPQVPLTVSTAGTQTPSLALSPTRLPSSEPRPKVQPLSATRYRVELTVSSDIKAKLERIKDLMRHRNPTGDLETILDASFDLLIAKLEKERLGKTDRPRRTKPQAKTKTKVETKTGTEAEAEKAAKTETERETQAANVMNDSAEAPCTGELRRVATTVPAPTTTTTTTNSADAVPPAKKASRRRRESRQTRREVFARDGEQCTYVGPDGTRCPARGHLELDHIHAKALGGTDDAANLRVRCRAHNHFHAEQVFGREYVATRIQLRRAKYETPTSPSFETAGSALRDLGFEAEVRRALATLATRLDAEATPIETIIREALAVP